MEQEIARTQDPALGYVGDVKAVNPAIIDRLLAEELIPVISTIGSDETGQAFNITWFISETGNAVRDVVGG